MIPKNKYLACALLAGLSCVSLSGQEKSFGDRLVAPHWQFSAVGVVQAGEGVHPITLRNDGGSYKTMLLTRGFVAVPQIRAAAASNYWNTSDEVIASSIPLLPIAEAAFRTEYAKTVQVPPRAAPETENTAAIEYRLHNCQVSLHEWPKRQ